MKKTFTAFNPGNLAFMGLLDQTYSFYTDLVSQIWSEWEKWQECHWRPYFPSFEKENLPRVKKQLNKYLAKYTNVFTDEYDTLFMSRNVSPHVEPIHCVVDSSINTMSGGYRLKVDSFKRFCSNIEYVVWMRLCNLKKREHPHLPPDVIEDAVYSLLECRINTAATEGRKKLESIPIETATVAGFEDVLYIFDSLTTISCNLKGHTIEAKVKNVETIDGKSTIPIPVHYCTHCRKTFIGSETLRQYQTKYGKLYATVRTDNACGDNSRFDDFSRESKLHALGYNVVESEMSEGDRRAILRSLIESGRISYFEACRDLTQAIRLFESSPRHYAAVNKWRSDLKYIGDNMKKKMD